MKKTSNDALGYELAKSSDDEAVRNRMNRRNVLLGGTTLAAASAMAAGGRVEIAQAQAPAPGASPPAAAKDATDKPTTEKGPARKSALSSRACLSSTSRRRGGRN